jgi:hypothetical protein
MFQADHLMADFINRNLLPAVLFLCANVLAIVFGGVPYSTMG